MTRGVRSGVGTGKTHLSIALGMACCQHDYRVRFVTAAELVTLLVEAQQQGRPRSQARPARPLRRVILRRTRLRAFDKAGADLLFGFISQRYERRSLVVTTNLPFARWSEVFLDPTAAAAVIDQAAERVHAALRRSGHYHPSAELDPERLNGAEKLLVMASDGEAGAGCHAWPPALSDREITSTRHAIAQYLIEATAAEPAARL